MELNLKGLRVVVAGGSRGIGKAIALGFAAEGCAVSICARAPGPLEEARAEIAAFGGIAHAASCDLSDNAAIQAYIPAAAAALGGGIDILVNNASGFGPSDDEASWEFSLNVDLLATVRATREALPFLEKSAAPAIVNIASGSGINPAVRNPAYGASKAAVIHFTRSKAVEFAPKRIRVNCIAPGSVEFPGGSWEKRKSDNPALYNRTLANIPFGRMAVPDEIARVVVFVASPAANWMTAQAFQVNGAQGMR